MSRDEYRHSLEAHIRWLATFNTSDFLLDQLEYVRTSDGNNWIRVMLDGVLTAARSAAMRLAREAGTAARGSCSICYVEFYRHRDLCIMTTVCGHIFCAVYKTVDDSEKSMSCMLPGAVGP